MSKKKPTAPIPLTGTVTITTDGRTTLAMKASHRGEDIEVRTGLSHCRPGDVYSEYEGARIALARLYGLDPFPQENGSGENGSGENGSGENGSGEKGHWEKATKENCKEGSRVRVVAAMHSAGRYHNGDQGILQDAPRRGGLHHILFDGNKTYTIPGCWLSELEVWVPDAPEEAKPQEAPIPEAPKPFTPSFQVGDIVRLGGVPFAVDCQGKVGKVGKVIQASETLGIQGARYSLIVNLKPGEVRHQFCSEWPNAPAPLELLFRDPWKDGEKA